MTYRRDDGTFAAAMTELMRAGQDWLAEQLGVTSSRLRQCANPMRRDSLPVALACQADILCAKAGFGTPIFDTYRRRLVVAGALAPAPFERRAALLRASVRAAATLLLEALRATEPKMAQAGRAAA